MWSTQNEIQFIRGLGGHRETGHHNRTSRFSNRSDFLAHKLSLLQKYQDAIEVRTLWEGINKHDIIAFVEDEIARVKVLIEKEDMPHA